MSDQTSQQPTVYQLEEFTPSQDGGEEPKAAPEEEPGDSLHVFEPLALSHEVDDPLMRARLDINEARKMALSIGEQAKAELAAAQDEAGGIRQKAYDEGYQQGQQDGMAAERARITATLDNLSRTVNGLDQARAGVMAAMEPEMVALMQACLDQLCLSQGAVSPQVVKQVMREAVKRVSEEEYLTVKVGQADLDSLEEFAAGLPAQFTSLKRLRLEADPDLHPGDCLVISPTTQVDATLATRKLRIQNVLEEVWHGKPPLDMEQALEQDGDSGSGEAPGNEDDDLGEDW